MNDKRLTNYFNLLSCWYLSTDLKPHNQADDGLRYMDATYLADQLHFKPRMIYKLTQQLLANKEITPVSKSYNGKGFNQTSCSKLYQIDKDIIENYILLLKMKYRNNALFNYLQFSSFDENY
ncbi:hypothetical protein FACS1894130_03110 [Spirochaetia bacterium]|nr:hypothetical protein FACS1894130_03110 [Spirochaetia bacterium]